MGINTHAKGLTGRIKGITSGIVKTYSQLHRGARKVGPIVVEGTQERALNVKKGIFSIKKSLSAMFRRPLSDISHLSIILVIILALFSGFSTFTITSNSKNISVDPFRPSQQASLVYVSANEKRILEADLVTTLATIHSDDLGTDAAATTLSLYQRESNVSGEMKTIAYIPILTPAFAASNAGKVIKYTVQSGDTLSQIASKFSISTDTVRYANKLEDVDNIKPGTELTILPVSGILYIVDAGDTIASVASKYNLSEDQIIAQNDLYGVDLTAGMEIVLPDAEIPAAPKPKPEPEPVNNRGSNPGISYVKSSNGPNHFPYGWCTWWVAQKRYVPWSGNAWQWYGNAQAYGYPVGQTPIPGAIMVTWESGYGHVAYVESANGNTFTVSEMNYVGWGIASTRTITIGDGTPIIGFIY